MRPFGWLEMKAAQGSMITVNIPMIYGPEGYKNVVLVELQDLVLTSSVNYAPLIALKELKVRRVYAEKETCECSEGFFLTCRISFIPRWRAN